MSEGCTDCGRKGGCDHRKGAMFAAIDRALAGLYPTRRFDDRSDITSELALTLGEAPGPLDAGAVTGQLAALLTRRLNTLVVELPPAPDAYCRQLDVLCFGRSPSLIEALHGLGAPAPEDLAAGPVEELYLRVSISELVPFAAVQQVRLKGELGEGGLLIEEAPRTGVFDPILLPRFRTVVTAIREVGLTNLDFGDISAPPPGFDAGDYPARFGGAPAVANYFFYPQPCASITTTVVPFL
jgi:hypothetical protein